MTARFSLRQRLRRARLSLQPGVRRKANAQINRRLIRHPRYRRARRIALYFAHGGEACVAEAIAHAHDAGKIVLIPRVIGSRLLFVPWQRHDACVPGRYAIARPALHHTPLPVRHIDVLAVPLVGFDSRNARLGQGGGYYDRVLACRLASRWRRPYLIGIGFGLQRVEKFTTQPWDVPMDTVIYDSITD